MIQKPFRGAQLNRTHPLAKGLVGCWLFNEATGETVFDSSGNDNNGTLVNGVAWGSNGLKFDGTDDYVDAGNSITSYPFTLEAWVKPINITDSQVPISLIDVSTSNKYYILKIIEGNVQVFARNEAQSGVSHQNSPVANEWNHIVGIFDNDTSRRISLNGVEGASVDTTYNTFNSGVDTTLIGVLRLVTPAAYLNGSIRSINVYNRALSAEEITWSYREPYAMFEPAFNPALLYSAAPPVGAIMNQFQKANIGADLYNGVFA